VDQASLEALLADLPLGAVRYFATVGSTNDLAARWAEAGARDLSLVVADEQTAGRGRLGRRWFTPRGAALAFSLILRHLPPEGLPSCTALGALAVCEALNAALPPFFPAQIKWPNDVVVRRRKLAGVLAEAHWQGEQLLALILGIGINVAPSSVPPAEELDFPATCVEEVVGKPVDRWGLLHAVLERLLYWRPRLGTAAFMAAWEASLAFKGEWVTVTLEDQAPLEGQVVGLTPQGYLRLRQASGQVQTLQAGVLHLRPSVREQGDDYAGRSSPTG